MRASPTVTTDPVTIIPTVSSLSGRTSSPTALSRAAPKSETSKTRSAPNIFEAIFYNSTDGMARVEELCVTIT